MKYLSWTFCVWIIFFGRLKQINLPINIQIDVRIDTFINLVVIYHVAVSLTLSWRRPLSYRNQSIDLLCSFWSIRKDFRNNSNRISLDLTEILALILTKETTITSANFYLSRYSHMQLLFWKRRSEIFHKNSQQPTMDLIFF